jgi:hypothetical protein
MDDTLALIDASNQRIAAMERKATAKMVAVGNARARVRKAA